MTFPPPQVGTRGGTPFPEAGRGPGGDCPSRARGSRGRGHWRGACRAGRRPHGRAAPWRQRGAVLAPRLSAGGARQAANVVRVLPADSQASLALSCGRPGLLFFEAPPLLLTGDREGAEAFLELQLAGGLGTPETAPQGLRGLRTAGAKAAAGLLGGAASVLCPRSPDRELHKVQGLLRRAWQRPGSVDSWDRNLDDSSRDPSAAQEFTHEREHEAVSKLRGYFGLRFS